MTKMALLTVSFSATNPEKIIGTIAIGTEVLVVAEGETLVHIEAHDIEDPEEPEEPENFVGILS